MYEDNPRIPRYRISLVRETAIDVEIPRQANNQQRSAAILKELYFGADREMLSVITLDAKLHVIGVNVVSIGALSQSIADPRDIFKMAILQNAYAIIHGHNHPSGDPYPSQQDMDMHRRLMEAGNVMGIKVLDGIVIGDTMFWSITSGHSEPYEEA